MISHKLSLAPFAEYVPFTNLYNGKQAKACLVKGWKELHSKKAKNTVEECPDNTWIQRRLRVRDESGNYIYCGFIVVDVDDQQWGDLVMNRIKSEEIKCQARKTKNGYHFIFRFVPNQFNVATSDWLDGLQISEPSESSHQKTSFVTDEVVDYKFTEIVRHIVDVKGNYIGKVTNRFDRVVMRDLCYDVSYTPEEQLAQNKKEDLPVWFPAYDDMPDWLIPIKTKQSRIPEGIMFYKEIEDMISYSSSYVDNKNFNYSQFFRCMDEVFKYKLVEYRNGEKNLFIYSDSDGCYHLVTDNIFMGIIDKILLNQTYGEMNETKEKAKNIYIQFMRNLDPAFLCRDEDMDGDENLVNFQNGMLDLRTGELKLHSPRYLSSIQIPCKWDTSSDTPEPQVFMKYLRHLTKGLPDQQEIISMILQYCGCCISNVPVHKTKGALIFQGVSNAGKSQLFNMMFDLIGSKYSIPSDLKRLTTSRFATSSLYRKRLSGNADLQHGATIESADIFKSLTAGDIIEGEEKFKGMFSFVYRGGLIYCCNDSPQFGDADQALYNRLFIVPCNNVVTDSERDPDLQAKFRKEYPQIVKLMLREMLKLKKNDWKLYDQGSVAASRRNYEDKSDNISDFVDVAVSLKENTQGYQRVQFWYDAYVSYCKEYRYPANKVLGKQKFSRRFETVTKCKKFRSTDGVWIFNVYPAPAAMRLVDKMY